jgi:hypothetical protein
MLQFLERNARFAALLYRTSLCMSHLYTMVDCLEGALRKETDDFSIEERDVGHVLIFDNNIRLKFPTTPIALRKWGTSTLCLCEDGSQWLTGSDGYSFDPQEPLSPLLLAEKGLHLVHLYRDNPEI